MRYPLASEPFITIQGEGPMIGTPMIFVRLAGCSVGCEQCDTDYSVKHRMEDKEIAERCAEMAGQSGWVWITGGEPTDHDLKPLKRALWSSGLQIALATAGVRETKLVDHLSVSPHSLESWKLKHGHSLNIVPGLNGLNLADWKEELEWHQNDFEYRYMTPLYGSQESLKTCMDWVASHPGWRLGVQAHKQWGLA
jgi:hypothetical protein